MEQSYDYVICGGGLVGCVLASRLSHAGHSVVLLEAGPEDYSEQVMSPIAAPRLLGSPLQYNMHTTNQPRFANRVVHNHVGKLLSGSSAVNYGLWTRGHSVDYDIWASAVGNERWSYTNMLPYFKKSETHYDSEVSSDFHGFSGPISTTAGARIYPLRETFKAAFLSTGLQYNTDTNSGNPFGFGKFTENWKNAQRQPAGKAYDLSRATVITQSTVASVAFEGGDHIASGVTLTNGARYEAKKEVILTCGALKTPQLLMLSGIGPEKHLSQHGIKTIANLPVGENFHDHISAALFWKVKHPEQGVTVGSPLFNKPEFLHGNPMEWIATISTPRDELVKAASIDNMDHEDPYLKEPRGNAEVFVAYAPIAGDSSRPPDGTLISTPVVLLLPTSRGSLLLADTNPLSDPVIDGNYLATETDRAAMRAGIRLALRLMETGPAREAIEAEYPPEGCPPLSSASSDSEIDQRISVVANSFYQNAGTAAMGTVVDSECRVKGVRNLRVCDASVVPLPIAGHYQAPMYAFAESVADLLLY